MNKTAVCVLGLASILALPLPIKASHITIETTPASVFRDGAIEISAELINRGGEEAESVWIEALIGPGAARSQTWNTLGVGESATARLALGGSPAPPGVYTAICKTRYTDKSGYPFSSISAIPVFTAEPDPFEDLLSGSLETADMNKSCDISLELKSMNSSGLYAEVTLVLPDEFICRDNTRRVRLNRNSDRQLHFEVENLSALHGSAYTIFAVVDYSHDGMHRSFTAPARISVMPFPAFRIPLKRAGLATACLLFGLFVLLQFPRLSLYNAVTARAETRMESILAWAAPTFAIVFLSRHIPPLLLLMDTLAVGGDTIAHNYLAGHLRDQLFGHGRIVSWAQGWWCGFPMFQFYFFLPYLLMILLDWFMPFNIAFKLISVAGIFCLPFCAFAAARILRFPRPVPALTAVAMLPLLFDKSNTMWGVNIYSTFAGMIANSISFPVMLIYIACAARDSNDGKFRLRTVLLLSALVASHFFTSVIAALTVAILPLLKPARGIVKSFTAIAMEAACALLLMAFWLVPLVAKREYSMDFGVNWDLDLLKQFSGFALCSAPFAVLGVIASLRLGLKYAVIPLWMFIVSTLLFFFGFDLHPVFVNVRLWPFVLFSFLFLSALGAGLVLSRFRHPGLAAAAILFVVLCLGIDQPNDVRSWAEWNYSGLETKPNWPVFRDLVLPLKGTPGRLANDLSEKNNSMGSSRVFEAVPHIIGKPILEGGIVNSAAGSMFSYYIQGETSRNCAGFPTIVKPAAFNFDNATAHLELFNVKHFIARWHGTKQALASSGRWRLLTEKNGWQLYEMTSHEGKYVSVLDRPPGAVRTEKWKHAGLDWMYTTQAINHPFVILKPGEEDTGRFDPALSETEFKEYLNGLRMENAGNIVEMSLPYRRSAGVIRNEEVSDNRIRFSTSATGEPHVIKCTYYPNWQVKGASRIYMITPCFMLIYPEENEVELYYGRTLSDNIGRVLTLAGVFAALIVGACRLSGRRRQTGTQRWSAGETE